MTQLFRRSTSKWPQILTATGVYISRLGMLPANFSPLGSFGFFSQNFTLFFATILAFDFFKGGFYKGVIFTYLGFAAYYFLGKLAKNNLSHQLILLPIASFSFFMLSNFGSWLYWYPHTWQGLLTCYAVALPFYQHTMIGDLFFGYTWLLLAHLPHGKHQYYRRQVLSWS